MAQYVYTMHGVGKIVPPKREILKNISLSFFPGAKIGVLGLNGSGKSTLLKIMAGLDKEIEGEPASLPPHLAAAKEKEGGSAAEATDAAAAAVPPPCWAAAAWKRGSAGSPSPRARCRLWCGSW